MLKFVLFAILKKVYITFKVIKENVKRVIIKELKRYYNNKDKMLQQRQAKCTRFKILDNRLKALEKKFKMNYSENKQNVCR